MNSTARLLTFALTLLLLATPARAQSARKLWAARFDGPAHGEDQAKAVAVDAAGNVIVTGIAYFGRHWDNSNSSSCYTAKYAAADGALLWKRLYHGPAGMSDGGNAVAVDSAGDVIITGFTDSSLAYGGDYYTAKYATNDGKLLWEHRYNGSIYWNDEAHSLALDPAGNVVVTGEAIIKGGIPSIYTAKYDARDGSLIWEHLGPDFAIGVAVALDSAGNVVVTGYNEGEEFTTAKYAAADGRLVWLKRHHTPSRFGYDFATGVVVDHADNVIATGGSDSGFYTVKYSPTGAQLWERRYHAPGFRIKAAARAVAVDRVGDVIVTGFTDDGGYTAKYAAADGKVLWQHGPRRDIDSGADVVVDSAGNVVVTGSGYATRGSFYNTTKYAGGNGALIWERRYGNNDFGGGATSVAAGLGIIAVTGTSGRLNHLSDFATVKYVDAPTPQTLPAGDVSGFSATLYGAVATNGFATNVAFEYGTDPALAGAVMTSAVGVGSGSKAVPVSMPLVGLPPLTTYYYRTIAIGNGQTIRGAIRSFTTQNRLDVKQ